MILTPKQRSIIRLLRSGLGVTAIAREVKLHRVTVSRLKARALRNVTAAGIDARRILSGQEQDLLDLIL